MIDQQAVVGAVQDAVDLLAGLKDGLGSLFGDGKLTQQVAGGASSLISMIRRSSVLYCMAPTY